MTSSAARACPRAPWSASTAVSRTSADSTRGRGSRPDASPTRRIVSCSRARSRSSSSSRATAWSMRRRRSRAKEASSRSSGVASSGASSWTLGGHGDEEPDRREEHVDRADRDHDAKLQSRPDPAPRPLARGGRDDVERPLRREGGHEHGPVAQLGRRTAGQRQDAGRRERVPAVSHRARDALDPRPAERDVDQRAGGQAARDDERHDLERQREQHRHEDQLCRRRGSGADVQLDARRGDVERRVEDERRRRQRTRRGEDDRDRDRDDEQRRRADHLDPQLTGLEAPWAVRAGLLQQPL